jgi:EpsI family protein
MTKLNDKKYLSVIILLGISLLVSWKFYFKNYETEDIVNVHVFPKEINGWTSEEIIITDQEYEVLETRNAFARSYTSPKGQQVILYIIYSDTNRRVAHPPEICYSGGGSTLVDKARVSIEVEGRKSPLVFNKLVMEQKAVDHMIYYLFKAGSSFTPSYWGQQFLSGVYNIFGNRSNSAMVRVSVAGERGHREQSEKDIQEFIRIIYPHLAATLK